jgi:hypothetical protein
MQEETRGSPALLRIETSGSRLNASSIRPGDDFTGAQTTSGKRIHRTFFWRFPDQQRALLRPAIRLCGLPVEKSSAALALLPNRFAWSGVQQGH